MTDTEIIKALEICTGKGTGCEDGCPCRDNHLTVSECWRQLHKLSLDLINRQKSEIEKSQKQLDYCESEAEYWESKYNDAKSEAIKEFKEKYKEHIKNFTGMFTDEMGFLVNLDAVLFAVDFVADNLVKEMTEWKEDEGK